MVEDLSQKTIHRYFSLHFYKSFSFLQRDAFVVPAASCGTGASIQNPLGKMATHALPRLTMDVRFPVLLLESPTLSR